MIKKDLFEKVAKVKNETKDALQMVFDSLNQGQQNKLLKKEAIVALFDRYGVEY